MASCVAVLLVTACSTGDARDAEIAEQREATKEAQLPQRQASFIANEFFGGTPPPVKTPTPRAVLQSIALTTGVNSAGAPAGVYGSVPSDAGQVYVAARIGYLQPGQTVVASWHTIAEKPEDIVVIGNAEVSVRGNEEWISLPLDLYGNVTPGDYAVSLYVDGELLNSLAFQITGAGTAPRQIGNA
ncbi:MAG TPA: hypothetical protein VGR16_11635 [Thermomicrobiales bacterium]|nr:hypothetical protein [Thermomicrobiales bacterium]